MTAISEYTSAAVSDRGLNEGRPLNQDAFLEMREYGIFVVADGVGGAQAGEVASQMAVEIIGEAFANMKPGTDAAETMRIALERANDAIFQMSQDLPQLSSMATTVVALHLNGEIATLGHVGDSRIYRVDPSGRLFRETDDHSVVEEEVRAGRMTAAQALNHPSRNVISRALGAEFIVEPDIKSVMVNPATTFLLCSDGITRHITDTEIESLLAFGGEPDEICARMKDICYSRGAEDNLTALVVSLPGERIPYGSEDDDIEEVTIAGIRMAADDLRETEDPELPAQVIAAEPEVVPDDAPASVDSAATATASATEEISDDEAYLMEEPQPVAKTEAAIPVTRHEIPVRAESAYPSVVTGSYPDVDEAPSGITFGKAVSVIGLLLAGMLIGAAATYMLFPADPPVVQAPVIQEQKSNNVQLTSFEETRRIVDSNPVQYLNANAASPQTADDYYWLGRALLLTGKTVEAKRMFEQAKQMLPSFTDASNLKTLTHEVEIGLAVVENSWAVGNMFRNLSAASNANSNTGNNLTPVR